MNKRNAYWAITGLFALAMLGAGVADLTHAAPIVEAMEHLGYPLYVATLLGVLKLGGAAALLAPGLGRIREWAYAGFAFDLGGAAISHLAVGDGIADITPVVVLGALLAGSYVLRPANRVVHTAPPLPATA